MNKPSSRIVGRAAQSNPANRFVSITLDEEESQLDEVTEARRLPTEYIPDASESIVSENNSPDLNFRFSLNPYRGCVHGCSYCYARTYHEYLGYSVGTDFETRVLYKPDAARLFRDWLNRKSYQCEPVNFSGGTDCYQPAEQKFQLTRQCLEVALASRQPVTIVTKNALVLRDLDLITQFAKLNLIHVNISVTSLDQKLTRIMEPRTTSPRGRLSAIKELSSNGVPVRALLSPVIPGLNDSEIPALVKAVSLAGASTVQSSVVRLPGAVEKVFLNWLEDFLPSHAQRIRSRIRQIRDGSLNETAFGKRMVATGVMADQIRQAFRLFAKKHGVDGDLPPLDQSQFRPPGDLRQRRLF